MLENERITKEQFSELTRSFIDMPISRTWRGYGSAIFFELGELHKVSLKKRDETTGTGFRGEAGIMIQWSWRVERPKSISFGSWSTNRIITNKLKNLQGLFIKDITVEGRLPELVIQLSSGYWVHSFMTTDSQPQWCLFLERNRVGQNGQWLTSKMGQLVLSRKIEEFTS